MSIGLLGKKIEMTQVFGDSGNLIPVSVIATGPCAVLGIKEKTVQLGFEEVKETKVKKPLSSLFKKVGVTPRRYIRELRRDPTREYKLGEELKVDLFKVGEYVDVSGSSIGKGFQGGMKRWGWKGGPRTHGSTSHRRIGSIGSSTTPGRVLKGHHLPGHMGNRKVTIQNLEVIKVDSENNLLLLKGAVPGHKNSFLIIRKAKKKNMQAK